MTAPEGAARSSIDLTMLSLPVPGDLTDYNGHLADHAYGVLFSRASVVLLDRLDLGQAYRRRTGCTVYVLEINIKFLKELREGDLATITCAILALDPKKFHLAFRMLDARGNLAAIYEGIMLHVRQNSEHGPKAAPFAADALAALEALSSASAMEVSGELPRLGLTPRASRSP